MRKIILDTNFLLIPGQLKVDIFEQIKEICPFKYQLYVLDKTIGELKHIQKEQRGKTKEYVNIALSLIKQKHLKIISTSNNLNVDDAIISLLTPEDVVATQDRELKKRVKNKGADRIILKQKKYLQLEG